MKHKMLLATVASILAAVGGAAAVSAGSEPREQDAVRDALRKGEILPLTRILAIAAEQVAGDVLKVEIEREHGVLIYEVEILTAAGRVREIKINARSGAVLSIEDD